MKKAYTKPYLAVESFQLDAAIANSCSSEGKLAINSGVNDCTFRAIDPNITQFGPACSIDIVNFNTYGRYNTFCYHGPTIDLTSIAINS